MAKYKVIALSVGAMSNKIFHSGDIVEDSAFPQGHAEQLVKEGFLKPCDDEVKQDADEVSISETDENKEEQSKRKTNRK